MPAFYGAIQTVLLLYASGGVENQDLVANAVFLLWAIVAVIVILLTLMIPVRIIDCAPDMEMDNWYVQISMIHLVSNRLETLLIQFETE